jgi:hypothetical protein
MSCNKQHIEEELPAGFRNIFIFDGMEWNGRMFPVLKFRGMEL